MMLDNTGLVGLQSELAHLDEAAEAVGFIRWQWEYYRATYDCKFEDAANQAEYFLRINTRAIEGKLENPQTVLALEAVYIGKATFPHGVDYEAPIPAPVMKAAEQKLSDLKAKLQ